MNLPISLFEAWWGLNRTSLRKSIGFLPLLFLPALLSCEKGGNTEEADQELSRYSYRLNNGEAKAGTAYRGQHSTDFSARLEVKEAANGKLLLQVTLHNTRAGETYLVHAHDAADSAQTPQGLPYREEPNTDLLALQIQGNGGTISQSQETAAYSYEEIVSDYQGFLIVHDPLQPVAIADWSSFLSLGTFARNQGPAPDYASASYTYSFNTGQVDTAFAYRGPHTNSLEAELTIEEVAHGASRIIVDLSPTSSGEIYRVHAHDKVDSSTSPSGLPYKKLFNGNILAQAVTSSGGALRVTQLAGQRFATITTQYRGYLVVHDPLQGMNTSDPTTFLVMNDFAE